MLGYLGENRVRGTQSTGNFPLKAVREIAARFVNPPQLDDQIGDKIYRLRSEEHSWPIYFVHVLASVGVLITGGAGKRWHLTSLGESFLRAQHGVQVFYLLTTWWTRVDWALAFSYASGEMFSSLFRETARQQLLKLPLESMLPFDLFADQLISATNLSWPYGQEANQELQAIALTQCGQLFLPHLT
jgi:hypothetical protein